MKTEICRRFGLGSLTNIRGVPSSVTRIFTPQASLLAVWLITFLWSSPVNAQSSVAGEPVPIFGTPELPGVAWQGPDWVVSTDIVTVNTACDAYGATCLELYGGIEATVPPDPEGRQQNLTFFYGGTNACTVNELDPTMSNFVDIYENSVLVDTIEVLAAASPFFMFHHRLSESSQPIVVRIQARLPIAYAACPPAINAVTISTNSTYFTREPGTASHLISGLAGSNTNYPTRGFAVDRMKNIYVRSPSNDTRYSLWKYSVANFGTNELLHSTIAQNPDPSNEWFRQFTIFSDSVHLAGEDLLVFTSPERFNPILGLTLSNNQISCFVNCQLIPRRAMSSSSLTIYTDNNPAFAFSSAGVMYMNNDWGSLLKVNFRDQSSTTIMSNLGYGPGPNGLPSNQSWFNSAWSLSTDKFGNLYFADNSKIRRILPTSGYVEELYADANGVDVNQNGSLLVDLEGNIYFLGYSSSAISKLNRTTQALEPWLSVTLPNNIECGSTWVSCNFDIDGNLYVLNNGNIYVIWGVGAKSSPDTTPPIISANTTETPSALGWFNSDVHLNWEIVEAESAVANTTGCESVTIVDDTAGRTFTCTATSGGGTASASYTVRRDTGNPLAFATRSPVANSDGWVNSVVNIRFSGLDGLSGIAGCDPDAPMTTEGAEQTSPPGTCIDPANNVSSPATLAGINIDLTPPEVKAILAQTPNASGWYNQALNIAFAATDLLSGVHVDACSGNQVFSADGQDVGATGTCRDRAGNTATGTVAGLKLDRTPPVTTFTVSPAANAAGWHRESVLVEYAGTDALSGSGLAACTPPQLVGTEGRAQSFPGQCSDVAGNTSPPADAKVSIDRQPPRIVVVAPVDGASYITGTTVAASYYCTDGLSGIVACAGSVAAGAALGTTTAGTYPFSVVAVDAAGHETRLDSNYTVTDASGGQLTSSSQLSFGNQAVGVSSAPQTITLVNSGTTDLTIAEVSTSGAQATEYSVAGTCVGTLAPGASCDIQVTLTPLAEGSRSASLVISLGTPLAPAATVPATSAKNTPLVLAKSTTGGLAPLVATTASAGDVGLAGVGVRPSLSIVDGPVDFGVRTVDQLSSPKSLTLSNNGEVPVDITSLYLDGNHQADFVRLDGCSAVLLVGETCAVRLVFQPSAIGRRSARLNILAAGLPLLSTEVRGIAVSSASPPASGPGSATAPALSALDLLGHTPVLSSGYYWFDIDGDGPSAAFITFADLETSGGGWMQVRRIPATEEWYPDDDDLGGAVALNTSAATQFNAASAWSHAFGSAVDANTEFLFAAGDYSKWCVIRRGEDLFGGTLDPSALNTVVLDSAGTARAAGERTNVMRRSLSQDPAIGCEGNEATNFQSLLYAEAPSTAPTQFKERHAGLNVFIRPGNGASRRPAVRAVVAGTESASGWYTSDVTVSWETDGFGSTPVLSPGCADSVVTQDGTNIVLTCEATNAAGSTVGSVTLQRDATPPVATATPSPLPNAAGWNKAAVSVAFNGTDATSGVATCSENAVVATEGESQTSASGTCTDAAGNVSAAVTYSPINIDLTAPSVAALPTPAANAAGWNNTAVTVSYTGTDALSGVAVNGCDAPAVLAANGTGLSATGACSDRAGNRASATAAGINIDTVAPVAYASVSPAANAANWHRAPVTISFDGTDSLSGSGVAGCSTAAVVANDGASQTRAGSCTDIAGNDSASASATVNLDQTAPTITLSTPANGASYAQNATVTAAYTCTDALSGVIGCLGTVPSGTAFSTSTVGTNSFTVQSADVAGNSATRTVSYTVTAPSPFTLSPTALAFGSRLVNSSTAQVVTVRNNTAAALALTAPTLSGTNANQFTLARTCGTSLAANASCTITATFKPTAAGAKSAAFSLRIGTTTQTVPLSGTGVAVSFTVAPSSIAFGNLARGNTSMKRAITVTNTTALPITLSTLSLGGTNANQFVLTRNCGTTLAATSSCTLDVQFKPTTSGSKRATVTVTPSGATAKTVALTGTGL